MRQTWAGSKARACSRLHAFETLQYFMQRFSAESVREGNVRCRRRVASGGDEPRWAWPVQRLASSTLLSRLQPISTDGLAACTKSGR